MTTLGLVALQGSMQNVAKFRAYSNRGASPQFYPSSDMCRRRNSLIYADVSADNLRLRSYSKENINFRTDLVVRFTGRMPPLFDHGRCACVSRR